MFGSVGCWSLGKLEEGGRWEMGVDGKEEKKEEGRGGDEKRPGILFYPFYRSLGLSQIAECRNDITEWRSPSSDL